MVEEKKGVIPGVSPKLILIAFILALLAVILVYFYLHQTKKSYQIKMAVKSVVVAGKEIEPGIPLTSKLLQKKDIPKDFIPENVVEAKDYSLIEGQTVRRKLTRGEFLLWPDIKSPDEAGEIAGMLKEGERAVSIAVDEVSSVGGMLSPNDHVDILGTFIQPAEKGKAREYTITVLQDVVVLAVGNRTASFLTPKKKERKEFSHVTLRLTPEEAEIVTFAMDKGKLTLILRNPKDLSTEPVPAVSFRELSSRRIRSEAQKEKAEVMRQR
jgi:pilus assembly protein CpaB